MYFIIYKNTYNTFSWLNPTILKISTGKQRNIKRKILIFKFVNNKLIKQKIKVHQTTFKIAVE